MWTTLPLLLYMKDYHKNKKKFFLRIVYGQYILLLLIVLLMEFTGKENYSRLLDQLIEIIIYLLVFTTLKLLIKFKSGLYFRGKILRIRPARSHSSSPFTINLTSQLFSAQATNFNNNAQDNSVQIPGLIVTLSAKISVCNNNQVSMTSKRFIFRSIPTHRILHSFIDPRRKGNLYLIERGNSKYTCRVYAWKLTLSKYMLVRKH